jgi:hypothetical protein
MRTTVQIDDDVLQAARSLAKLSHRALGEVLSDLARRGLTPRRPVKSRSGFPTFDVPRNARPITFEMVKKANECD